MKSYIAKSVIILGVVTMLSACGAKENGHGTHRTASGDIQEKTASLTTMPTFLSTVHPNIKKVYELAAQNLDLIQWIPCYCGCAESAGHQSNENCFIKEVNKDGSVVWDDHGTRCNVCLEIALKSIQMKQEGKTTKEIRNFIDNTYKSGYAKPTSTPMPTT